MTTLLELVQEVQKKRELVAGLQSERDYVVREFNEKHQVLFGSLGIARQARIEAEESLYDLALQVYAETGNKTPSPGVGIRVVTKLIYDAGVALLWATQHSIALKLDIPAFEKIAKASKPDFVELSEEPQATIATDLGKEIEVNKPEFLIDGDLALGWQR